MAINLQQALELSSDLERTLPYNRAVLYRTCWTLYSYRWADTPPTQEQSYEVATIFALILPNFPQSIMSIGGGVSMADYWQTVERLSASPFGEKFKEYDGRELRDALVTSGGNAVTYHTGGLDE